MACGSRNLIPLSVSPKGTPGRAGSPRRGGRRGSPPQEGFQSAPLGGPLAPSPRLATPIRCPRESVRGMRRRKGEIKDGHHVGLDFYDLLIEPILVINGSYVMWTLPLFRREHQAEMTIIESIPRLPKTKFPGWQDLRNEIPHGRNRRDPQVKF